MRDAWTVSERAEAIMRIERAVFAHWKEGLTALASSERLGCSERAVTYIRAHLRLQSGQQHRAGVKPIGRSRDVVLVVEMRT